MHELGHLFGHEHGDGGVMDDMLAPGTRKFPDSLDADDLDSFFTELGGSPGDE